MELKHTARHNRKLLASKVPPIVNTPSLPRPTWQKQLGGRKSLRLRRYKIEEVDWVKPSDRIGVGKLVPAKSGKFTNTNQVYIDALGNVKQLGTTAPTSKNLKPISFVSKRKNEINMPLIKAPPKAYLKPEAETNTKQSTEKNNKKLVVTSTQSLTKRKPGRPKKIDEHFNAIKNTTETNSQILDTLEERKDTIGIRQSYLTEPRPNMPASVKSASRTLKMANNTETRKIHKTHYQTGFYPSKAIRMAAKIYGTGYSVMQDSKMRIRDVANRNRLTWGAGFNSKQVHLPCPDSQITYGQVRDMLAQGHNSTAVTDTIDATLSKRVVASMIRLKRQFLIHNTSALFPMNFKIYLLRFTGTVSTTSTEQVAFGESCLSTSEMTALTNAINASGDTGLQPAGKVPWQFQHGGLDFAGSTNLSINSTCNFSLKGQGVFESTYFKNNFKVVETFQKQIPPGDFWNFSHTHNLGGGIDIAHFAQAQQLTGTQRSQINDTFTDVIMFETWGTLCEGIFSPDGTSKDQYLGTSPTYYSYEFKNSAYYVKTTAQEGQTDQTSGITTFKVHRREYISDPLRSPTTGTPKEIFVLNDDIVNVSSPAAGKMYIPMFSGGNYINERPNSGTDVG